MSMLQERNKFVHENMIFAKTEINNERRTI